MPLPESSEQEEHSTPGAGYGGAYSATQHDGLTHLLPPTGSAMRP